MIFMGLFCIIRLTTHIADLSARTVLALLKDGYEVSQLALSWNDQVQFVLKDDFSLGSLKFQDGELEGEVSQGEGESRSEKFDADFIMTTATLSSLLGELAKILTKE